MKKPLNYAFFGEKRGQYFRPIKTKQRGTKKVLRCFGKARKEEADCKASRPVVPKAKPYSSTNLVGLKVFWLLDRFFILCGENVCHAVIAVLLYDCVIAKTD